MHLTPGCHRGCGGLRAGGTQPRNTFAPLHLYQLRKCITPYPCMQQRTCGTKSFDIPHRFHPFLLSVGCNANHKRQFPFTSELERRWSQVYHQASKYLYLIPHQSVGCQMMHTLPSGEWHSGADGCEVPTAHLIHEDVARRGPGLAQHTTLVCGQARTPAVAATGVTTDGTLVG